MLNELDINDVCYEIEKTLRSYSAIAVNKACKVFAVYDICREDIGKLPELVGLEKVKQKPEEQKP